MIELAGLGANFAGFNLEDINLCIGAGEYFVLLGPTGAGKTLLLESIAGLYNIDTGHIYIKGKDVTRLSPECRQVGIVYQDYALFPHMDVEENIAYGLKQKGTPRQERKELVSNMADFLEVTHLLTRYPKNLSGGEKQRTALARALVVEPEILLLDEPSSALDGQTKKKLHRELRRIHKELHKTVLHITHDLEEALSLGDRIGIMEHGRVIQVGSPQEIFRKPVNQFVAQFFCHDNIFRCQVQNKEGKMKITVETVEFSISSENICDGEEGFLLIPAEGIILSAEPIKSSARNLFCGPVTATKNMGAITDVTLDIGIPLVAKITASSAEDMGIKIGDKLFAAFKATSLHFFS